ncbi:hypothetical protein BYT27DRAFT_6508549 [Phlegmacium glaucopus]|nr:hypothetical protein BYT27DRAFT_6508549 [Phlegmacium glaucopus]
MIDQKRPLIPYIIYLSSLYIILPSPTFVLHPFFYTSSSPLPICTSLFLYTSLFLLYIIPTFVLHPLFYTSSSPLPICTSLFLYIILPFPKP